MAFRLDKVATADFTALQEMIEERRAERERQTAGREAIEKALMNGPNVERMERWELMMARDAFNESDHSREEKGRFTEKEITADAGTISEGTSYGRIESKRKEIRLSKTEYARVMHELNTNLTKEQRRKKWIVKYIGDYMYKVEIHGFDEYRIIGKEKI